MIIDTIGVIRVFPNGYFDYEWDVLFGCNRLNIANKEAIHFQTINDKLGGVYTITTWLILIVGQIFGIPFAAECVGLQFNSYLQKKLTKNF